MRTSSRTTSGAKGSNPSPVPRRPEKAPARDTLSPRERDVVPGLPPAFSFRIDGAVAVCIAAITLAALYFFYSRGLTNIYGDAIAHMEGARRIFDSLTPGYSEIGTVWLPLFHLFVAPLATSDFLWRTGLAGSIVSCAAFAGTAWILYRFGSALNEGRAAGLLALAVFLLSPNLLYLASTPLTEPLAIFWSVLAVYELFRYQQSGRMANLIVSAGAACLGTLTRYEEWYVLPFAALFVLLARRQYWQLRVRHALIFSLIAGAGPALWLLHNAYRFANPMEFYNGPFSAQAIYAHQLATTAFPYPTDGKLLLSAQYYVEDLKLVFGVWPLELAALGLVAWIVNRPAWEKGSSALLFLVPLPFYVNALAYAAIPLYAPTLFPFSYYNLRYGAEMIPALALFTGFLLPRSLPPRWRNGLLAFFVALLVFESCALFSGGAERLVVAREGMLNTPCRSERQQAIIRVLRSRYDGGRVLVAAGKWPCVFPEVGIHFRNTVSDSNREYWRELRTDASKFVEWIIRGDGDPVDDLMRAYPQAFAKFELVEKDSFSKEGSVEIYRKKSGE
ncbi:MAG: glycosyltransferase family 39 protein [Terriglobia bacterium]